MKTIVKVSVIDTFCKSELDVAVVDLLEYRRLKKQGQLPKQEKAKYLPLGTKVLVTAAVQPYYHKGYRVLDRWLFDEPTTGIIAGARRMNLGKYDHGGDTISRGYGEADVIPPHLAIYRVAMVYLVSYTLQAQGLVLLTDAEEVKA